ncbi:MAG: hypothetical protein M1837_003407 [Sclerophora amabilis]|nr:MAG: hypothetical protein M1837_003407 [Sclerophora amabilis]
MTPSKHQPSPQQGTLHKFSSRLVAFEHAPPSASSSDPSQNILIFIGGLSDGLLTVPYTPSLASHLPPGWSLAQVLLSSSYTGWGSSSVSLDAREISECVAYFRQSRGPKGKIVLLGHSTGCQDVMEYLTGKEAGERPKVDGGILQAPVSDREAMSYMLRRDIFSRSIQVAQEYVAAGNGEDILPAEVTANFFGSPCSARRWLSLASPDHNGEDDYFSSDLSDDQLKGTFGKLGEIGTPLCILYSEKDQFVSPDLDKHGLVKKWISIAQATGGSIDEKHSGVIREGNHTFEDKPREVVEDLERRITGFIDLVQSGDLKT